MRLSLASFVECQPPSRNFIDFLTKLAPRPKVRTAEHPREPYLLAGFASDLRDLFQTSTVSHSLMRAASPGNQTTAPTQG
jgi:hypothetical protein